MKLSATILLGAMAGLFLAAVIMSFSGCGGAQPAPAAPSVIQTIEDCWSCATCAKDVLQRAAAAKADAGHD